jgi:hypothetical protein
VAKQLDPDLRDLEDLYGKYRISSAADEASARTQEDRSADPRKLKPCRQSETLETLRCNAAGMFSTRL